MSHPCRKLFASRCTSVRSCVGAVSLAVAICFGGWQAAQLDWAESQQALDSALWSHALQERETITDLAAVTPTWREREGASGDKIVERIDQARMSDAAIAVLGEIGAQALPAPLSAREAAKQEGAALSVKPARFNGLGTGDRLTITTTDGDIYSFEVVASQQDARDGGSFEICINPVGRDHGTLLYAVRPVAPQSPANMQAQQDL